LLLWPAPAVRHHVSKRKPDDEALEQLHHILFKNKGAVKKRKSDIYQFSGFVFEVNGSWRPVFVH
jgi:hypothetical protein